MEKKIMTQEDILKYYNENGGLRCKGWSLEKIRNHIKDELGDRVPRILRKTCLELRNTANMYQR